jgi:hypothetical protein
MEEVKEAHATASMDKWMQKAALGRVERLVWPAGVGGLLALQSTVLGLQAG